MAAAPERIDRTDKVEHKVAKIEPAKLESAKLESKTEPARPEVERGPGR